MLTVAIMGSLWVPVFARSQPQLGGFPFFYWYQLILVPVTSLLCWIIAFVVVTGYTYLAGLRAPALIAFVKDTLIYLTVIVAILYIPSRLGGWSHVFGVAKAHLSSKNPATGKPFGTLVVLPAGEWAYASLALGSALALFVNPHAVTGATTRPGPPTTPPTRCPLRSRPPGPGARTRWPPANPPQAPHLPANRPDRQPQRAAQAAARKMSAEKFWWTGPSRLLPS